MKHLKHIILFAFAVFSSAVSAQVIPTDTIYFGNQNDVNLDSLFVTQAYVDFQDSVTAANIPVENVYNTPGALTGHRTVTMGGYDLRLYNNEPEPILQFRSLPENANDALMGGLTWYNQDGNGTGPGIQAAIKAQTVAAGGGGLSLNFWTDNSATGLQRRMIIDGNGNIGIGNVPTPVAPLHVLGGIRIQSFGLGNRVSGNEQYILGVEADGDIIEIDPIGLGGKWSEASNHIYRDSDVGIGSSTVPIARLTVKSEGFASRVISAAASDNSNLWHLYEDADGDGVMYLNDKTGANKIKLGSIGNSFIVGGNLGIGVTDPAYSLEVGATSGSNYIQVQSGAANTGGLFFGDGTNGRGRIEYNHNGDYMRVVTASSEKLRITSTGNVGIGTNSPNELLTLKHDGKIGWQYTAANSLVAHHMSGGGVNPMEFYTYFTSNPLSESFKFKGTSDLLTFYNGGGIRAHKYGLLNFTGTETAILGVEADGDVVEIDPDDLNFWTKNGNSIYYDDTGNISIGHAVAHTKFQIQETSTSGALIRIQNRNNVVGSTSANIQFSNYSATSDLRAKGAIGFSLEEATRHRGDILFAINNSNNNTNVDLFSDEKMRLTRLGRLGIGTDTPGEMLEVAGNVEAVNFIGNGSQLTNIPGDGFEANTDNQTITDLSLTGTTLSATLSGGNTETADLSSLKPALSMTIPITIIGSQDDIEVTEAGAFFAVPAAYDGWLCTSVKAMVFSGSGGNVSMNVLRNNSGVLPIIVNSTIEDRTTSFFINENDKINANVTVVSATGFKGLTMTITCEEQ